MIKVIVIALLLCIIEIFVIVVASPIAKPSVVLKFLPEDVRNATKPDVMGFTICVRRERLKRISGLSIGGLDIFGLSVRYRARAEMN